MYVEQQQKTFSENSLGYSLMELLAALTITAVLASLAAPAFATLLREQQSLTVTESLATGYQLARTTAMSTGQPTIFCARGDDTHCGNNWMNGTLVFTDTNSNQRADNDERILANLPALPTGSTVRISTFGNRKYLRFTAQGFLENYTAGNIIYCPPHATARDARNLIFTRMGRLRLGTDKNNDGVREDANGKPLSCNS